MTNQTPPIPPLMKIVPPMWIVILLVFGIILNSIFPSRELMYWQSYPAAAILFVLGVSIFIWTISIFRKRGTEILPHSPTNTLLLTDGPFKVSRNPIYLGMTLALLGIAFCVGTLPMFVVPVAFFCLINFVFIPFEEAKMLRQFGEQFADFKRRVRRWI